MERVNLVEAGDNLYANVCADNRKLLQDLEKIERGNLSPAEPNPLS